MRAVQPALESM
jgi:hypothetical protein